MSVYSLDKLMSEARRLAAEYRRTTGKTLPITGEIAIHDAVRLLDLEAAPADSTYDAVRRAGDTVTRIQVKGRAIFDQNKPGHRLGNLKVEQAWDSVVLVLMDDRYEPVEIYEAARQALAEAVESAQGTNRAKRGPISVARFKNLGRLVWSQAGGRVDDGYWSGTRGVGAGT